MTTLFSSEGAPADVTPAEEQQALVALSLVPGVGPGRIRALIAACGSASAVLGTSRRTLAAVPGIGPQTAAAIAAFDDFAEVEEQVRRAEQGGAVLVPAWDARFPRLLREIYDPPVFLWMRGDLLPVDEQAFAIVGTRRASDYGRRMAEMFATGMVERGFTIVSGLAYGIDAAAHQAAVNAGGRTLAVLGSGVDRIYPARHTRLANAIEEQGAILSEYPLGAAPDAPNFPRRNRIISGLAVGTLVVEAFETGGALITARLAVEQNREVFAIPSPVHSSSGVGTNRLIQRGHARLVLSVDDILDELGLLQPGLMETEPARPPTQDLPPIEQQLYHALEAEPKHIDAICEHTDLDSSTALVYLLSLEFKGLVRQLAGKQFHRV